MTNNRQETWQERFDKIVDNTDYTEYTPKRFCCGGDYCEGDHNGFIKNFISKELSSFKEKVREAIKQLPSSRPEYESDDFDRGMKQMKSDILALINLNEK